MEQDALNPVAGGGYESWAEKGHGCVCGKQQGWGGGILQSSSVKRASCVLTELCWVPEGTVSCVCSAIFPGCAESLLQAQGHGECRAVWGRCRSSSHTFRVRTPWGSPEAGSLGPSLSLLRPTLPPHPDRPVSLDHACTAWKRLFQAGPPVPCQQGLLCTGWPHYPWVSGGLLRAQGSSSSRTQDPPSIFTEVPLWNWKTLKRPGLL